MGDVMGDINARRGSIQSMTDSPVSRSHRRHSFRCPKCSATSATFAPRPRAAQCSPWRWTPTTEVPKNVPEEIIKAQRGE